MRRNRKLRAIAGAVAVGIGAYAAVVDDSRPVETVPLAAPAPLPPVPPAPPEHRPGRPLVADLVGSNGVSRVIGPGLGCDGDSPVEDIHLLLEDDYLPGTLSQLPGDARANLGISEHNGPARLDIAASRLEPATSHVTLANERGTLRFRLDGGACPAGNLAPADRATGGVTGTGALTVLGGTGSYRDATFNAGTWGLTTGTDPGADNQWTLDLDGTVAVLSPELHVDVVRTTWGHLGVDYATRTVSVTYRITNNGAGDSYGTTLTATTAGPGVTALGPVPQPLGDLLAGDSVEITVRYRLALLGPPCDLVLLGCDFDTTLTVRMPDALDDAVDEQRTVSVSAPDLPPPLEG